MSWSYAECYAFRWPTDVATFLPNVSPQPAPPSSAFTAATFTTLSTFSDNTYLTTSDDATPDTEWLRSEAGKPNATGYSAAPAQIIVAPKEGGIVDAFYFMFFAYNAGPTYAVLATLLPVYKLKLCVFLQCLGPIFRESCRRLGACHDSLPRRYTTSDVPLSAR